ncbi:hypothetical protein KP509_23G066600 [Ceratopteris richardii]|uniref:Uncharacterized protein n=1 Tax=Ceratopteris richardii TaxID=49495 RepID=A0A8T2S2M6_CERRI|nr:hypothetical protein KP509_23G066600 [Ceratopteris richardii]
MTRQEFVIFLGTKIIYAIYMFALRGLFSHYDALNIIRLYVIIQLVFRWVLPFLFQVAHVVEEASFPMVDSSSGRPMLARGWAPSQVMSTMNFNPKSNFLDAYYWRSQPSD